MERLDPEEYGKTDSEGDHHFKKVDLFVSLVDAPMSYMREADAGGDVKIDRQQQSFESQRTEMNPDEKHRDFMNADKPRDDAQWSTNRRRRQRRRAMSNIGKMVSLLKMT